MQYPGDILCLSPAAALARLVVFAAIGVLLFFRPDIPVRAYMWCVHFALVEIGQAKEEQVPDTFRLDTVHRPQLPPLFFPILRVLRVVGLFCLLLAAGRALIMAACALNVFA
jgi:hypothetical protein